MVTIKPIKKVTDLKQLKLLANQIRQDIIEALVYAGSGHTAGPLGMADVFTALYFNVIKHNPKYPFWEERDRVVLSNGHICPEIYSTMAHAGYFPKKELKTLRHFGSRMEHQPEENYSHGLETTSGPFRLGIS